jgi:hypothetical protein
MIAVVDPVSLSSQIDPTPQAGYVGEVWEVYNSRAGFIGYLVTEAGDVNLLIAFIQASDEPLEQERPAMLRAARRIAQNPTWAGRCRLARDLREFCTLDSPAPIDPEVYGWYCGPVGGGSAGAAQRPMPYCRFRFAAMLERHNQLTYPAWERDKYPHHTAGIRDDDGGSRDQHVEPPDPAVFLSARPLRVCRPPILTEVKRVSA